MNMRFVVATSVALPSLEMPKVVTTNKMAKVESKSVDELRDVEFDFAVTLCDNTAQTCPLWLGSGRVKHMGFPDPAADTGSEAERLGVFRQIRDGLRQDVFRYLDEMGDSEMKGVFYATGNL